ncbi:MerR family transcriptional regulator [Noviherbaspirillum suwonense]|uniref:Mercuric resistance operon regulatory protein n=1 Tax=Noviherbaspirillum suwonense TaxID=1224511 RepID=A0ABY1QYL8_9BURK|nr:MerR family DNA-binding protein [Noviherbaspirillum suwonense]RYD89218.1 MAG: MerR family transcriptional regulator [Sphingobacteriales bacterium]SMP81451.1 MerR family transcriptional regulator, mercuric resistance operon regulatory protein [Noviherbaspirillum suwonense]
MAELGMTIGRLAKAANVGVETVRYYQQRNLLPVSETLSGAYRIYSIDLVDRIRFIKRAQELGFSLEEISIFLQLGDGTDRHAVRSVASERLIQIQEKIADLKKMEATLFSLVQECKETGQARACPIIAALRGGRDH